MQLTRAGRWSLVALVVVVALIVAIWPRDADDPAPAADGGRPTAAPVDRRAQDTPDRKSVV